ncbi:hypothetical protein B0I35DRAFT_438716 [Stachybotrys elegans]|uniref:BTB domain-containing protein n=1 Tax=Stachybotrys elegans TaxID=80388 RepID=A0A8K0SPX6_9HYPO|nr:hypothetical protein B0I35DRAFT_438716 [Stachybotrys elegans]
MSDTNGVAVRPSEPVQYSQRPASQAQPPAFPIGYPMPPPFQPVGRPIGIMPNGDSQQSPELPQGNGPGPQHFHRAHHSNGSVQFGAFPGSTGSSPAPLRSGGIVPPPGMPMPDGRQPFMGPGMNVPAPMLPYMPEMMQGANMDTFAQHSVPPFGPADAFPPYAKQFGPPTPRNFHDSHPPTSHEEGGIYQRHPPNGLRNGMGPSGDDIPPPPPPHLPLQNHYNHHNHPSHHQSRSFDMDNYPRILHNLNPPPPHMETPDGFADIPQFIRHQFNSEEFADCTLELRIGNERHVLRGHKLLLARSPALAYQMRQLRKDSEDNDEKVEHPMTLMVSAPLELVKKGLIQRDAFYMAIQALYGWPLLESSEPPGRSINASFGSNQARAQFALSYATAGDLLGWGPVVTRGALLAGELISWSSVEQYLDFALIHSFDSAQFASQVPWGFSYIMEKIVRLIWFQGPPNFKLDRSQSRSRDFLLPQPPPNRRSGSGAHINGVSTNGTPANVNGSPGRRVQQLRIQFGDLTTAETADEPLEILSRVLFKLPFHVLDKMLHGSTERSSWNPESLVNAIGEAIEAREEWRRKAIDDIKTWNWLDSDEILTMLRKPEPPREEGPANRWSVLGWRERIVTLNNIDGPQLERSWSPLGDVARLDDSVGRV